MDVAFAVIRSAAILVLGGLWLASVAWISWDARRRLRGPRQIRLAVIGGAVMPVIGLFLYLCFRPPESLLERRERRLVRRLLELELEDGERCLVCRTPVRAGFRCCPGCGEQLGGRCSGCGEPLRLGWQLCPHCETPAEPAPLRAVA